MRKHFLLIFICGLVLLWTASPTFALMMFNEVALGTTNPSIVDPDNGLTVNFTGSAYTDDGWTPGDPYLASGFGSGSYDTFIGANADGFLFDAVSFSIASEMFLPPETTLNVSAVSAGSVVDSMSLTINDYAYHSMGVSFADGFDSIRIWDDLDASGLGEFFHIDSFSFTAYVDDPDPTAPVPEPATMVLLGTGLTGLVFSQRKKLKK